MKLSDIPPHSIRTYTGKILNLQNPQVSQICIEDIAHGLTNVCRFAGQLQYFYSVAEHSICCSCAVPRIHKLQALLHDATEAYLGDIASPIKKMMADYQRLEHTLWLCICQKFGIDTQLSEEVKEADNMLLIQEWNLAMIGAEYICMDRPEEHFLYAYKTLII